MRVYPIHIEGGVSRVFIHPISGYLKERGDE